MDYSKKSKAELIDELNKMSGELSVAKHALSDEIKVKKELEFILTERKKYLNCHNLISHIFSIPNLSKKEVLLEVLEAIPPSWQFSEITQALIEINNEVYKTPGYEPSKYELIEPVFAGEKEIGRIIVSYPEDQYKNGIEAFHKEESDLLKSIAVRIGNYMLRDNVEKQAAENEMMYKTFLDASPDAITITDLNGSILFHSPGVASVFGYAPETSFVNRNIGEFIHKRFHSKAAKTLHNMFEGNFFGVEEYEGIRADGKRFNIEVNANFVRDAEGRPSKMIFISRDISSRKKIEKELVKSERQLKTMVSNLPGVSYLCLPDEHRTMLFLSESYFALTGYKPEIFVTDNPLNSYANIIHPKDRRYVIETIKSSIRKQKPFELEYRIITSGGEEKYVWEKGTGIFEKGKLLFVEGLIDDVTQRKLVFDKLREREEKYRFLVESINDVVYEIDANGTFIYVSPVSERLFGYKAYNLIGTNLFDYLYKPDIPKIKDAFKNFLNKSYESLEYRILNKHGEIRWVRSSTTPIVVNGVLKGGTGLLEDISESKEAEKEMLLKQKLYREAQRLAKLGHWEYDIVNDKLNWSEEFFRILDLSNDEEKANYETYSMLIHPDDRKFSREAYLKSLETRKAYDIVYRLKLKSGNIKYVNERCFNEYDDKNRPIRSIGTVMDITNRVQLELDLKKKEERFEQIAEQSQTVIWEVDKNGLYTYVSPTSLNVWGYSPSELVDKMHYYDLHPEKGREEFIRSTKEVFSRKRDFQDLLNLIVKKDGNIITVSTNGIPVTKNNVLEGYRGADIDVTEKLKAEEELNLFKRATDHANYGFVIVAETLDIIYVNKAFAKMHNWEVEDFAVNEDFLTSYNEKQKQKFAQLFARLLHKGSVLSEEIWHTKADGTEFPVLINASLIEGNGHNSKYLTATVIDITEIKEAQLKLKHSEQRYRAIFENIQDTYYEAEWNGEILEVSPSVEIMSHGQYKREDLIGRSTIELYTNPEERERFIEEIVLTGRVSDFEISVKNKDGSIIPVAVNATFQADSAGNPIKIIGSIRDITERKLAADALKRSENRYKSIFTKNQSVMLIIDPELGNVIDANDGACSFYGWPYKKLIRKKIYELSISEDEKINWTIKDIQSGHCKHFFSRHRIKEGEIKDVEIFASPIEMENKIYIYIIIHDITYRKKAEEALAQSERDLKNSQEIAKMGSWEFSLKNNKTKWSENMSRIYGVTAPEEGVPISKFVQHIHPDDRELFQNLQYNCENGEIIENEFRYIKDNGEVIWLKNNLVPLFEDEKLVGLKGTNIDITEKKKAEQKILDVNARLNAVLDAIPDLIFIVKDDGTFIDYYVKEETQLALPREKIIGASVYDTFPPDDAKFHFNKLKECLQKKELITYDYQIFSDSQMTYYEARLVPFSDDSVLILSHDITLRKQNETTITKLSLAIEQSPVMKMITDINGDIEYINPAFEKITGYQYEEIVGKNPRILKSGETPDSVYKELWTEIRKGNSWHSELLNRKKSGELYWEDINISSIRDKSGQVINFLAIKRDITDWKKAQDEIRELTTSLEKKVKERTLELEETNLALIAEVKEREATEAELLQARIEAEKANQAKSEFISRMSHELRTPMNSILGFAQLLNMGSLSVKQEKGINHILNSGKHLLNLINEVLEISRIESGKLFLSLEPVNIDNLFKEIIDILANEARQKGIEMRFSGSFSNMYVKADKQKLKQVLLNLCNNSIKYNKENGNVEVKVTVVHKREKKQDVARISISDTGIGIAKENVSKLFSPFERIGADKTLIEGSGLGLAVSKKLTEAMNGEIGLEDNNNEGCTFFVEFPLSEKPKQSLVKIDDYQNSQLQTADIKANILYIEDNESNIDLVKQALHDHRPGIRLFYDKIGTDAVQIAKKMKPDLILLDLSLPEIRGEDILEQIIEDKDMKHIPVVIISADAMPEQIDKVIKIGAKKYITKPLDMPGFLKEIDKFIKEDYSKINGK